MDPWDVPEPKTLKSLPNPPGRRLKPDESGAPTPVKEATDAPPLQAVPTEETSPFANDVEVITTPPPARERLRSGMGSDELTEESPKNLSPPPPTTEEMAPTTDFESDFFSEQPPDNDLPMDQSPPERTGTGRLLLIGGIAGLVAAGALIGVILWKMADDNPVESDPVIPANTEAEQGRETPPAAGDVGDPIDGAATDTDGAATDTDGAATDTDGAATDTDGAATDTDGAATDTDGAATDTDDAPTGTDVPAIGTETVAPVAGTDETDIGAGERIAEPANAGQPDVPVNTPVRTEPGNAPSPNETSSGPSSPNDGTTEPSTTPDKPAPPKEPETTTTPADENPWGPMD